MVRKDAPEFKSNEEVARWLDGKIIAAPKGSASDQYLRRFFEKYNVKPGEYLNQVHRSHRHQLPHRQDRRRLPVGAHPVPYRH